MAISFIGSAEGSTTATMPAHQAGDLLLVYAFRDGSATFPTTVAGFTNIASGSAAGTSCSGRLAYKIAASSSEVVGTWTNATSLIVAVYRGTSSTAPIGGAANFAGTTNSTYTIPAVTMAVADGSSWIACGAGHRSVDTNIESPPTGTTLRQNRLNATSEATLFDTDGGVSSWTAKPSSITGTASGYTTYAVELTAGGIGTANITEDGDTVSSQALGQNWMRYLSWQAGPSTTLSLNGTRRRHSTTDGGSNPRMYKQVDNLVIGNTYWLRGRVYTAGGSSDAIYLRVGDDTTVDGTTGPLNSPQIQGMVDISFVATATTHYVGFVQIVDTTGQFGEVEDDFVLQGVLSAETRYGWATITEADDTVVSTGVLTGGITGTASITEADDTLSATGVLPIVGTASITEAGDTVSSTSKLAIAGSVSVTEAGDTLSSTAKLAIAGVASITEAGDTLSSTGRLAITGTASITEAGDTLTSVGLLTIGVLDLTSGTPTVGSPLFGQTHSLAASGVSCTPVLASLGMGQIHALSAPALTTGAPTLDSPALVVSYSLSPTGLSAAPVVAAPSLGQIHSISATGLSSTPVISSVSAVIVRNLIASGITASPTLQHASISQIHALSATGIASGTPDVPDLQVFLEGELGVIGISTGSPSIGSPTTGQVHVLTASGITASPAVSVPAFAQQHVTNPTGVTSTPVVASLTLGASYSFAPTGISASPVVPQPLLDQKHILLPTGVDSASPTVGSPALTGAHQLSAVGVTSGAPVVSSTQLAQIHQLVLQEVTCNPTVGHLEFHQIQPLDLEGFDAQPFELGSPSLVGLTDLMPIGLTTSPTVGVPDFYEGYVAANTSRKSTIKANAPIQLIITG